MLPPSTPAEQGVDGAGLMAFVEAAPAVLHSLMIVRHGHVIAQGWWSPYSRERPQLLYSLSKSFVSTAACFAVQEGLLDLDAPLVSYFPGYDGSRSILVRHALSMASGHLEETWQRAVTEDPDDPVRGFLRLPPDREPGSVFAYNQPNTYTVAAIIQRATGRRLLDYLRPRLLEPLGITGASWTQGWHGHDLGFSGLHATTDAVARLGQLYLDRGRWGDRQLLPEAWVAEATRRQVATPPGDSPDWARGYGFQFWMSRYGYRGDGAYGQFCLVLPEQDAVVAITSGTEDMQGILDLVWRHVLPAFDGPGDPAADEALRRRLAEAALPVPGGSAVPADPGAWSRAVFTPAAPDPEIPVQSVMTVPGEDGWRVTLAGHDLRLGGGGWEVQDVTAVAGGWRGDTLTFEVVFLETPHRLTVTCALPRRTFQARWNCVPLHARSWDELRAPDPAT